MNYRVIWVVGQHVCRYSIIAKGSYRETICRRIITISECLYWISLCMCEIVFVFENTGAYCMTEGISLFLSRDLPSVALLKNGKLEFVREAYNTYLLIVDN